jgi:ribonuclease VapC
MRLPSRPLPIDLAVDTSALISILNEEPTSAAMEAALAASGGSVISTASLLEAAMVASNRLGADGPAALDRVCASAGIITMPVDNLQLALAREAFAAFGKGRHPAALNFGDCFSYALATHFDVPLLCTGSDFSQTDLRVVP